MKKVASSLSWHLSPVLTSSMDIWLWWCRGDGNKDVLCLHIYVCVCVFKGVVDWWNTVCYDVSLNVWWGWLVVVLVHNRSQMQQINQLSFLGLLCCRASSGSVRSLVQKINWVHVSNLDPQEITHTTTTTIIIMEVPGRITAQQDLTKSRK